MVSLFKEQSKLSAYRDSRIPGTQEDFELSLLSSATVCVENMSFYSTEEQVYELFTRAGEIKKIIMVLDKHTMTPCGFCFVVYYSKEDTKDPVMRDDNGVVIEAVVKGGYGKLVQKELKSQRQLVDYGAGSLESFPPVVLPPSYGRQGGSGDNYRHGRDYHRKQYREDDRRTHEPSKRNADYDSNRNSNPDSKPKKNPRFRESGDSDDDEDHGKRRP